MSKRIPDTLPTLLCKQPLWLVEEDDLCASCPPPRLRKCFKLWCQHFHAVPDDIVRKDTGLDLSRLRKTKRKRGKTYGR